jgi:hypothetical protein
MTNTPVPELGSIWIQIQASRRFLPLDIGPRDRVQINVARDFRPGVAEEQLHRSRRRARGLEHSRVAMLALLL